MSDPIQVTHRATPQAALARLMALARQHEIELTPDEDGASGTLEKSIGFLGSVRGRYRIDVERVEVAIESTPAAVGEATVRRLLAAALAEAFGA